MKNINGAPNNNPTSSDSRRTVLRFCLKIADRTEFNSYAAVSQIFLIIIMELPVSRSTVSAIGMRLLRQLLLK